MWPHGRPCAVPTNSGWWRREPSLDPSVDPRPRTKAQTSSGAKTAPRKPCYHPQILSAALQEKLKHAGCCPTVSFTMPVSIRSWRAQQGNPCPSRPVVLLSDLWEHWIGNASDWLAADQPIDMCIPTLRLHLCSVSKLTIPLFVYDPWDRSRQATEVVLTYQRSCQQPAPPPEMAYPLDAFSCNLGKITAVKQLQTFGGQLSSAK